MHIHRPESHQSITIVSYKVRSDKNEKVLWRGPERLSCLIKRFSCRDRMLQLFMNPMRELQNIYSSAVEWKVFTRGSNFEYCAWTWTSFNTEQSSTETLSQEFSNPRQPLVSNEKCWLFFMTQESSGNTYFRIFYFLLFVGGLRAMALKSSAIRSG